MSKSVRDRIQLSRTVILAGHLYADAVAEACKRRLQEFQHRFLLAEASRRVEQRLAEMLPAGGPSSLTLGHVFRFIAMDLEELGEAMAARDEDLTRRRAELRRCRRRRDRLAKRVYRELSQTRKFFIGILGYREGCDYLDLKGPTPRDPVVLSSWSRRAAGVLADAEKSPARDWARGGKLKTSDLAKRLATRRTALQEAITAVAMAEQAVIAALAAQQEAIAAFDGKHKPGARVFEAVLDYFGLPSLAETVRPGVKRRGRPPKQRPVDQYPDLVARVLGEEHLERTLQDELESAETAGPGAEARQEKIEQGSRELKEADPIIEQDSCELSTGERKIEQGSRKPQVADQKIENPACKSARRRSSHAIARLTPRQRGSCPRRRMDHGPDSRSHRRRRPRSSDPVPVGAKRLRQAASAWWRRLKRPASGTI
ncbi:MAG: hypothetical protein GY719_19785 [bacterium]|nr:hypothetical protein [bacterium]